MRYQSETTEDPYSFLKKWQASRSSTYGYAEFRLNRWTELKYISHIELREVIDLIQLWGAELWRLHASWELVKNYDLEAERQKKIRQIA